MDVVVEINCDSELWNNFIVEAEDILKEATHRVFESVDVSHRVKNVEISVLLTDNESMQILNNDYRGKDKPTNVLSFPSEIFSSHDLSNANEDIALGDLAFAYETIEFEAQEQEKDFKGHFTHLAVHGILHLLGYNHIETDEAEEMEAIEISVLKDMGVDNPY